jgi:pSer/pThr/pTyr-binding forkhead associated (FHA) protein
VIVCPKCSKENQDHYKFCLGCGNELPRDSAAGRGFRNPTPTANPVVDMGRGSAVPDHIPPAQPPFAPQMPPPQSPFAPQVPPPQQPFAPQVPPPQQQPFAPQVQPQPPFAPHVPPPQSPFAPQVPPPQQPFAPQVPPPQQQPFAPQVQPQPPFAPQVPPPQPQPPFAPQVPPQPPPPPPTAGVPMRVNPDPGSRPSAPAMPAACPQCASPNPRANRFCITCGFDMATVASAQPPAPAPALAPDPMLDAPTPSIPGPSDAPRPAVERARLVLIRPDGTEGGHHSLMEGDSSVGRDSGGVFSNDPFLSPKHASFAVLGGSVTVRDEGSLNGIYIRIERQQPVELHDGDVFRIGQEILRFEAFHPAPRQSDGTERIGAEVEGLVGKIVLVTGRESFASAFPVPVTGLYLGRERGDILFPEDGYVSGLHCQLAVHHGRLTVTDVGSSNGSYVRLHGPRTVRNGDFLLLGQQLFRVHVL